MEIAVAHSVTVWQSVEDPQHRLFERRGQRPCGSNAILQPLPLRGQFGQHASMYLCKQVGKRARRRARSPGFGESDVPQQRAIYAFVGEPEAAVDFNDPSDSGGW